MKKIASFTVNHLTLLPGVYVSRKDHIGAETVTTFDIRMTRPNYEPVMRRQKYIRSSISVRHSLEITKNFQTA